FINAKGQDFSELDKGNWHLHFAMRGTDNCSHQISFGQAKFTIGATAYAAGVPVLGNYARDGEWYSFDIPYETICRLATEIFPGAQVVRQLTRTTTSGSLPAVASATRFISTIFSSGVTKTPSKSPVSLRSLPTVTPTTLRLKSTIWPAVASPRWICPVSTSFAKAIPSRR
ncbi:MAG: hypothetical protein K2L28_02655, partial [Muribaculaceae bacterium]|nr:hypothetical protein [Muribaculaceae bacterium]